MFNWRRVVVSITAAATILLGLAGLVGIPSAVHSHPQLLDQFENVRHNVGAGLTGWDDQRLKRLAGESDLDYARRLTRTVHMAGYFCAWIGASRWPQSIYPPETGQYGILAPELFRCGYCHQFAYLLSGALVRGNVEAKTLGLNGHVVTTLVIDGQKYIADPLNDIAPFAVDYTSDTDMQEAFREHYSWLRTAAPVEHGQFQHAQYQAAFAKTEDDAWYNQEHLDQLAAAQALASRQAARVSMGSLAFGGGLAVVVLCFLMWRRRRA